MLTITIPPYVPNSPPVAKNPALTLSVGETVSLAARGDLADDADPADPLTVTAIVTPPNSSTATALINGGQLEITAVAPGHTTTVVTVDDQTPIPPPPSAQVNVTVGISVLERTPDLGIEYVNEELTGLIPGFYVIDGDTVEIAAGGATYPLDVRWFGATLSIRRVQPGSPSVSSLAQLLPVPARPDAPAVAVTGESFIGYNDGWVTGVSSAMEYRPDTVNAVWKPVTARYLDNLPAGDYLIRSRAVPGQQFVGEAVRITVEKGHPLPVNNPINRLIRLPSVPGVTSSPLSGLHTVASQSSFTFTLKFSGAPLSVYTSRMIDGVQEELTGVAGEAGGYEYVIRNVQSEVAIYIGPTVGNTVMEKEQTVWASGDRVYVKTDREDTAVIYNLPGQVVRQAEVSGGVTSIALPAGMYVVMLRESGVKRKVMIRDR
jgi:hypothetical protein